MSYPLVVDYSWARPDPVKAKSVGVVGVMRYVTGTGKALSRSEARAILAAGLWIGLVYESGNNAEAGTGYAAGRLAARTAEAAADALGYPASAVIFYAVDYDAAVSSVSSYFQGVVSAAKRPVGVYGSADVVTGIRAAGLADYAWQTVAWSGGVHADASLYQYATATKHHPLIPGSRSSDYDENDLLKPFPAWGSPAPQEDFMAQISDSDAAAVVAGAKAVSGLVSAISSLSDKVDKLTSTVASVDTALGSDTGVDNRSVSSVVGSLHRGLLQVGSLVQTPDKDGNRIMHGVGYYGAYNQSDLRKVVIPALQAIVDGLAVVGAAVKADTDLDQQDLTTDLADLAADTTPVTPAS